MRRLTLILLILALCMNVIAMELYENLSTPDSIRVTIHERNPAIQFEYARSFMLMHIRLLCSQNLYPLLIPIQVEPNIILPKHFIDSLPHKFYHPGDRDNAVLSVNRNDVEMALQQISQPMIKDVSIHFRQGRKGIVNPTTALNEYLQALSAAVSIPLPASPTDSTLAKMVETMAAFLHRVAITEPRSIALPEGEPLDGKLRIYYRSEDGRNIPMQGIRFTVNGKKITSDLNGDVSLFEPDTKNSYRVGWKIDFSPFPTLAKEIIEKNISGISGLFEVERLASARLFISPEKDVLEAIKTSCYSQGFLPASNLDEATHCLDIDVRETEFPRGVVEGDPLKRSEFPGFWVTVQGEFTLREKNGKILRRWTPKEIEAYSQHSINDAKRKGLESLYSELLKMMGE